MPPLLILAGSVALVIGLIVWARLHAFLALLIGATCVALATPVITLADVPLAVTTEFGAVVGRIGVIIALASFIGIGLQQSGGAARIGAFFLSLTGQRRGHYAMAASGYVLSIPVFFDTVFYLLVPLARAMHASARWGYPLYLTAVMAGAAATHVFVPPTPGPLAAASQLGVDLGLMIVMGVIVSMVGCTCGVAYARWALRRWPSIASGVQEEIEVSAAAAPVAAAVSGPGLALSLLPIALPLVLIASRTASTAMGLTGPLASVIAFVGDANIALFGATLATVYLLVATRRASRQEIARMAEGAFESAGTIILITAAGGAYGAMLTRAQVGATLADEAAAVGLPLLLMAFLLASLLKVAQGSSTVAIITTASVLAATYSGPAAAAAPHPVYAALAAAGGSLVVSWMNDSGFWIVARMGRLTTAETLRLWTVTAAIVGTSGFLAVLLLEFLLPLR
jgi:GntP family gluconate:H+ symporter